MKLPSPPPTYHPLTESQRNRLLESFANATYTKGQDVGVYQPAKLIVSDVSLVTTDSHTPTTGSMSWNSTDATLDLGLDHDVTYPAGQALYARVRNNTGVTIPKGTVVGLAGASGDAVHVGPYIANAANDSINILGVMAHDLPDSGEKGYCTVFGFIRGINTSSFSVGDGLYASPTVSGGMVNSKPTAPNGVIPLALCMVSHATEGVIAVRPTIEQQEYYGAFSDTTTMSPAAAYTPYAITFNTTDFAKGFSRGSPTSRIVAVAAGLYNFQFSAEVASASASAKKIWIWPRVNGVDVPNSNSEITVSGAGTVLVPAWNWVLSLNANDYFEIVYAADDTNVQIVAAAAQTGANGSPTFARPGVPSIILTVTQVQQ